MRPAVHLHVSTRACRGAVACTGCQQPCCCRICRSRQHLCSNRHRHNRTVSIAGLNKALLLLLLLYTLHAHEMHAGQQSQGQNSRDCLRRVYYPGTARLVVVVVVFVRTPDAGLPLL